MFDHHQIGALHPESLFPQRPKLIRLEFQEVGHLADDISDSKKFRCGVSCFRYGCIIIIAGSNWEEASLVISTWS